MRRDDLRQYLDRDPTGVTRRGTAELIVAALESRVHVVTTLTSEGRGDEKWDVHIVIDDPEPSRSSGEEEI